MDKRSSEKGFNEGKKIMYDVFRFVDDLNAINDGSNFRNICPEESELRRENGNNAEAHFSGLDIKVKNNEFYIGLFGKRDSFLLSITRVPEKSSNIPLNIFYMSTGAKCLRIARACNQSFSLNSINPLVMHMFSR